MDLPIVSCISPEEDVEAEHGEHDGQVAQDPHCIAQLVDQQEPFVHHPEKHTINQLSEQCSVERLSDSSTNRRSFIPNIEELRLQLMITVISC